MAYNHCNEKQNFRKGNPSLALGMRKARSVAKRSGAMEQKRNLEQPGRRARRQRPKKNPLPTPPLLR